MFREKKYYIFRYLCLNQLNYCDVNSELYCIYDCTSMFDVFKVTLYTVCMPHAIRSEYGI